MKKYISYLLTGVVGGAMAVSFWSCASENPFDNEGSGVIQLRTVVNNITTRATEYSQEDLEKNCVVYISDKNKTENALVYKKQGLQNVDSQITLKSGSYVAEAWTGDSVPVSFDKKFYRGYQDFEVEKGSTKNVVLNCKIANVVASINAETIDLSLMNDDYKITIKSSNGEKTFTKDSIAQKAYFMMPNGDTTLKYSITGTRKDGKPFGPHTGIIENVERAHEYILNFEYNPNNSGNQDSGYVFIKINIKEEEISNDNVTIFTRPTISGVDFDLSKQLVLINDKDFPEMISLQICGDGLDNIILTPGCCLWSTLLGLTSSNIEGISDILNSKKAINFSELSSNSKIIKALQEQGLEFIAPTFNESKKIETAYLNFSKDLLKRLAENNDEHVFTIDVSDKYGQNSKATLSIARTEQAVKPADPIELKQVNQNDWNKVKAYSAFISYTLAETYEGTPGVEYRKAGSSDAWQFMAANTQSKTGTVTLAGLQNGTQYEYRACCGDFHSDIVMSFTTESTFLIPNSSMEDWSSYQASTMLGTKNVTLPSNTGDKSTSFWGSGNEGSATANMTLTNKSTDMVHSGSYSAKLGSAKALGMLAAGNIFIGEYVKTDGTNGVLSVGREYNGSHPSKVKVYANYRPGKVDIIKDGNEEFIKVKKDGIDHGQIYVALTNAPVELRTNPNNRKLFDTSDKCVLAYGEITWTDNFGPDGSLQEVEIPFTYNDRANNNKPKYLVIVCSASKYGDYFSGSSTSVMYVDDFELIYE